MAAKWPISLIRESMRGADSRIKNCVFRKNGPARRGDAPGSRPWQELKGRVWAFARPRQGADSPRFPPDMGHGRPGLDHFSFHRPGTSARQGRRPATERPTSAPRSPRVASSRQGYTLGRQRPVTWLTARLSRHGPRPGSTAAIPAITPHPSNFRAGPLPGGPGAPALRVRKTFRHPVCPSNMYLHCQPLTCG